MKKSIIILAAVSIELVIAGLFGALGNYQLSFVSLSVHQSLSWLSFAVGCWLMVNVQMLIIVFARPTQRDFEQLKNQNEVFRNRVIEYSNRAEEAEIKEKMTDHAFAKYRNNIGNLQANLDMLKQSNEINKAFVNSYKNQFEKYRNLYTSTNANLVKVSNQLRRRNESVEMLRKMYAELNINYSFLNDRIENSERMEIVLSKENEKLFEYYDVDKTLSKFNVGEKYAFVKLN